MKIDVYDSYAQDEEGRILHFDVFVDSNTSAAQALNYGRVWLEMIGESKTELKQSQCNFCHSRTANPEIAQLIQSEGYFILQMEGCPQPFGK